MIKRCFLGLVMMVLCDCSLFSQTSTNLSINDYVDGTLLMPDQTAKPNLAILISDYGPVDRNGNQNFSNNNGLKKIAEALAKKGIASFRYDKRTFKLNQKRIPQNKVSFDDFVMDAQAVINYLIDSDQFKKIILIGHGQGSLVAMLSSNNSVDGLVSIGGSAKPIDEVIVEQVTMMDKSLGQRAQEMVDALKLGNKVTDVPQALNSIFSTDIQPFMSTWMKYDPKDILNNLEIPVLIINGTNDLQVSVEEAQDLAEANKKAKLKLIDDMNHVFFIIKGDDLENSKSYNEPFRKVSDELVDAIEAFIND